jgi:hypothetical protein
MKVLRLILIAFVLLLGSQVSAQVSVSVNIGSPPLWGPVGYTDVHYYYLPDVEAYYDVQSSMFIYYRGGSWVHRTYLPTRYRNYDLYNGYKVVMTDYRGNAPYSHFKEHRSKYARGYHGDPQRTIGERPGRGNPGPKVSHGGNHRSPAYNKAPAHRNDKNIKRDNRGNGKGKKR